MTRNNIAVAFAAGLAMLAVTEVVLVLEGTVTDFYLYLLLTIAALVIGAALGWGSRLGAATSATVCAAGFLMVSALTFGPLTALLWMGPPTLAVVLAATAGHAVTRLIRELRETRRRNQRLGKLGAPDHGPPEKCT